MHRLSSFVHVFSILRVMTMEFGRCDSHMIDRRLKHTGEVVVVRGSVCLFFLSVFYLKNIKLIFLYIFNMMMLRIKKIYDFFYFDSFLIEK